MENKYQEEISQLQSQTKSVLNENALKSDNRKLKEELEKQKTLLSHKDIQYNNELKKNAQLMKELDLIKTDIMGEYKEIETLKKTVLIPQNILNTEEKHASLTPKMQPLLHAFSKAKPSTFSKSITKTVIHFQEEEEDQHINNN